MLPSIIPSLIALGTVALVAASLARTRPSLPALAPQRRLAAISLAIATGIQTIHLIEETLTGFHEKFSTLFGLPPMSLTFFVSFNVTWIVIWLVSIKGLTLSNTWAYFAAWFLAIAALMNGVAHPMLAIAVGGYFPGLFTSPFIAIAGIVLFRRLLQATAVNE